MNGSQVTAEIGRFALFKKFRGVEPAITEKVPIVEPTGWEFPMRWWWRIGVVAVCLAVIAVIVAGKGMLLLIGLPAIAATATNLWSARRSVRP